MTEKRTENVCLEPLGDLVVEDANEVLDQPGVLSYVGVAIPMNERKQLGRRKSGWSGGGGDSKRVRWGRGWDRRVNGTGGQGAWYCETALHTYVRERLCLRRTQRGEHA